MTPTWDEWSHRVCAEIDAALPEQALAVLADRGAEDVWQRVALPLIERAVSALSDGEAWALVGEEEVGFIYANAEGPGARIASGHGPVIRCFGRARDHFSAILEQATATQAWRRFSERLQEHRPAPHGIGRTDPREAGR